MSRNLFSVAALTLGTSLFFYSCKEQPAGVFFGEKPLDSTYVASVESPQTKNYYIEEFTGVRCTNCPAGALLLEEMSDANPGRLKIVSIHAGALTAPSSKSKQDMRSGINGNGDGMRIATIIYSGDPSKPAASVDRLALFPDNQQDKLLGNKEHWQNMLETAKNTNGSTPVNMEVSSTYDAGDDEYNIRVKIAYTEAVTEPYYLSIYLVEDNIIDLQVDPETPDSEFNHVFRQSVTPFNGSVILDSIPTKEAGRVFVTNHKLKIDLNDATDLKQKFWNLDNIHVVAFVHKSTGGTDKRIIQVVDAPLK